MQDKSNQGTIPTPMLKVIGNRADQFSCVEGEPNPDIEHAPVKPEGLIPELALVPERWYRQSGVPMSRVSDPLSDISTKSPQYTVNCL